MKKIVSTVLALIISASCLMAGNIFQGVRAASAGIVLGINAINTVGAEGHSLLVTPGYTKALSASPAGFSWWRSATFEWNDDEDAYVVRSVNLMADGSNGKNNYVPENGFVLAVNIGNDYGNINYINKLSTDCYNDLAYISPGDKAYLVGIDIAKGTVETSGGKHYLPDFVSDAKIYIGEKPAGAEIYTPDTSLARLDEPVLDCEPLAAVSEGVTVSWEEVENAEYYLINVNTSTIIPDGTLIINKQKVSETSFTLPANKVSAGYKYTVSVAAGAEGYRSSYNARAVVAVVSDRAANSPFLDKKIMAFGDSITYQPGWVAMLAGELGTDVLNAGVGGDKTTEAVARLQEDVISHHPDIVFVLFGMNDQALSLSTDESLVSLEQYEKNYRHIIKKLLSAGASPVLLTGNNVCNEKGYYVPGVYGLDYGIGNLSNYYAVIRGLAEEYELNLIDINKLIEENAVSDETICAWGDGIHLSVEGHAMFAEWISDYMYNEYFEITLPPDDTSEGETSSGGEESGENSGEIVSEEPGDASEGEASVPGEEESGGGAGEIVSGEPEASEVIAETSETSKTPTESKPVSNTEKAIIIAVTLGILGLLVYFALAKPKKK